MNSQVADLVGDRDGGRASTPAHTLTHSPYQGSPLLQKNRSRSKKPIPSQARKRESSAPKPVARPWIPACAGMTEERKATVSPNAIALSSRGRELKSPHLSPSSASSFSSVARSSFSMVSESRLANSVASGSRPEVSTTTRG